MKARPLYSASGVYTLRAPTLNAHALLPLDGTPTPPFHSLQERRVEGREALLALAASPRVKRAIHAASPSLGRVIRDLTADTEPDKDQRRALSALLRYVTRMSTRPTPFGAFAGVTVGTFGTQAPVVLEPEPVHAIRTRADTKWLHAVLRDVLADTRLRERLPVRVNDLLCRTGNDVVLYRSDLSEGHTGNRVQLRANRLVDAALRLAASGPPFRELVTSLTGQFPTVGETRIRRALNQLWDVDILMSDLQVPAGVALPERYLADQLAECGVDSGVVENLRTMQVLAAEADRRGVTGDVDDLADLGTHQRRMAPTFAQVAYRQDTLLATTGELPDEIATAAAEAGETLLRLGGFRTRRPHLVDYSHQFVERYGHRSELPLVDVLDPERGIGPPDTYHMPPRQAPLPSQTGTASPERDQALVELVAYATRHGLREVELDDGWFTALQVWRPEDSRCLPRTSLDLYFQLASGGDARSRGGPWRIVLNTTPYGGGLQSLGRFLDSADERAAGRIREHVRAEEALLPDTVFVELNFHHANWEKSNITVHPSLRGYEICVNVPPTLPPDRQLHLDDVLVGLDADQHFYLRSARLGRRLQVVQAHPLNAYLAPNICRALLEFSADGTTPQASFNWGVARNAPFLPRLVHGGTVVCPAQWTVTNRTFPADLDSPDSFFIACQRWRSAWDVPRYVYLAEIDNRLLLDLEHPLWVDELYREVLRSRRESWSSSMTLHEALPAPDDLWLHDRAGNPYHAEITVPLVLREPRPDTAEIRTGEPASVTRRWLPGDTWVHLKLYCAPERQDGIVAGPLRSLVQELRDRGLLANWFYVRYVDPLPHLRLRFHAPSDDQALDVISHCAAWGGQLVATGQATDFAFASYDREVERYGGPQAIEMLETIFARNSDVAADLVGLAHANPGEFDVDILGIAALHALYRDWGAPPPALRRADTGGIQVDISARERFRTIRPLLCEVLVPGEIRPGPRAGAYRDALTVILDRQRAALGSGGHKLRRLAERGLLTGSEEIVIDSLAHMQSNRLIGVDRTREQRCHELWRLALHAINGRPGAAPTS